MHQCIKLFYFGMTLYMFRTVFPSIIRSSRLCIQQRAFVKQIVLSALTFYMFRTVFPSIIRSSRLYIQQQAFVKQILLSALTFYMFRTVFPSIIRSSRLYIQQPNRYYSLPASKQAAVSVWHMPVAVCIVLNSWWWTERPSETCRVSFQTKINLIHWYSTSSWFYCRNNITMHDPMNVKFSTLVYIKQKKWSIILLLCMHCCTPPTPSDRARYRTDVSELSRPK